ncbi:hypothetical protein A6723_016250 [Pseudomonas sp. AU11447]|nr:hypothetical protein A6723_016250 [Pseudomonas sp. AU11447]
MARIEPVLGGLGGGAENPYQVGEAALLESDAPRFSKPGILDFHGRISLARYWLIHVGLVVWVPTLLLIFFVYGLRQEPVLLLLVASMVLVSSLLLSISLLMRRARDIGWSPAWGLVSVLVPGIGALVMLPLVILPGQKSTNRYGAPNPFLSTRAKALIGLLVVLNFAGMIGLFVYFPEYGAPVFAELFSHFQTWLMGR